MWRNTTRSWSRVKTQSAKAKGRRLQQWCRDQILETFNVLKESDVRSISMGASGTDVQLSTKAKELFPFSIECKNTERVRIWDSFDQAEANCEDNTEPLLVIKRNGSAPLAVVDAEWLFENVGKLGSK